MACATACRQAGTPTIFCCDLLHHFDLEVALRHQLLQPRVLLFELLQPPHVVRLERPKSLLPRVDRLLAHPMALGYRRHRVAIRLPQHHNDLLFREPRLLHPASSCLLSEASLSTNRRPEYPGAAHHRLIRS
jgi:hypothetical protein